MDLIILLLLALPTPALAVLREFYFINENKSWAQAQSYCRENFLDLVTIENAADWARVSKMAANADGWGAWIGMYDDAYSWRWSLDNTSQSRSVWFDFVIANKKSKKHCVELINPVLQDTYCSTLASSVCYHEDNDSYVAVTEQKNWTDAQSYCRQSYTDLASIRNQEEWDKVMDAMTTIEPHWVGLSREGWKWSDRSSSTFRKWGEHQPTGGGETCGIAKVDAIFDASCSKKNPFICSVMQSYDSRELHFVNLSITWTEAQNYCRANFSDLVTIENDADWAEVSQIVSNSGGQFRAWIGLYDDVESWRWSLYNMSLTDQSRGSWFSFTESNYRSREYCAYVNNPELHDQDCSTARSSLCYDETSNSYISITDPKTWQDAQSDCRQNYTDLASIRSEQEWITIMDSFNHSTADHHWIGLSREGWKWSDRSNSSFRHWQASRPLGSSRYCGGANVSGMFDDSCSQAHPFICSVVSEQSKVLKVTLKADGSVNLNDPLVQKAILKQMEKDLKGQGVHQKFNLRWKTQPHGDVFNKTEL